jgi:hypothetical protein
MKSLKDKHLKSILVNPKFDDMDDRENVLQQEEDLALVEEYRPRPVTSERTTCSKVVSSRDVQDVHLSPRLKLSRTLSRMDMCISTTR